MVSLQPHLTSLLETLPPRPIEQEQFDELVEKTLEKVKSKASNEVKKQQWEYVLKSEVFKLAATEGKALQELDTNYYDDLRDRLDLVLMFTEHDACEQTFPFTVLQDLLETQTIASCSHIFSWIEARATRLTAGMVPQKGKALILLRTLNDLLRRLSKMGSTTIFCGRILTFLSGVFPLGERSGVNLRGEYGPTWDNVEFKDKMKVGEEDAEMKVEDVPEADKMDVDSEVKKSSSSETDKKEDFYNTFWSLQLPFSKPPLFSSKETFPEFREAVNKVIPVVKEATAKERAMMGSRTGTGTVSLKRKRDADDEESNTNEYFFAKFLTSPDLLDLEIADTHFRRQFLFQLLILLNHLLAFTKAAKANWATTRNRSLQMDFTLDVEDAKWVQETITRIVEELKQTAPNGRLFSETVNTIIDREKNWVKWKNELCAPFDKEPWFAEVAGNKVSLFESTKAVRENMRVPPEDWKWRLGSEPLTEIWDMGYRDLWDLQNPFQPGDIKDFVKKIKQEDARTEMRKTTLMKTAQRLADARAKATAAAKPSEPPSEDKESTAPMAMETSTSSSDSTLLAAPQPVSNPGSSPLHPSLPAKPGSPSKAVESSASPAPAPAVSAQLAPTPTPALAPAAAPTPAPVVLQLPADDQINKFEENKQRWAWLALRTARDQYLQHFGKIGTGDVVALLSEIEKEKEREKMRKEGAPDVVEEHGSESTAAASTVEPGDEPQPVDAQKSEADGDVKMDVRVGMHFTDLHMVIISRDRAKTPIGNRKTYRVAETSKDQIFLFYGITHIYLFTMSQDSAPLKNVLVTGGAGYIGSHVIYTLQKTRRYKVISLDNNHNSKPASLERVSQLSKSELPEDASEKDIQSTEIDSYKCDLTQPDQIRAVFEQYGKEGIWGVIHIAAYKAVGESTEIPLTYYVNNVSATIYLLQAMAEYDCTHFVYSSSATVYGTPPTIPIPESTRLQADSPYGKTKVMAETIINDLCHADKRWRAISLRYFNPAGAHPSGLIGEDPKGRPGNLLPLLAHMAIGRVKDATLKVFGNDYPTPDGTCVRDYLHILDLASGHVLALDALAEDSKVFDPKAGGFFKAYNLGKGKGVSVLQIVEAMRKATGFDYKYEIIGRRRGDVPDLTADPTLAETELGFKAPQDLETMCRDLWNWQTKNPMGYDN
ncbi:THO complex subunit 1 transcription elongation factor-domain-containing protein [Crucibulum laeve]|uniref:THO complex subunit 1 transcription elongation factor-domain-containing protein n=1 Tax=Crucibulum laeve TaxID=68775 RepID=A0A5C3M945_9AGAR|nr:THO complex subunit 1 transcription elongation factor-domain-containing protein [Crucibulum laeve]